MKVWLFTVKSVKKALMAIFSLFKISSFQKKKRYLHTNVQEKRLLTLKIKSL